MQNKSGKAVVARVLLPAGLDLLEQRFEVSQGGLHVSREQLEEMVPGAVALVPDPSVSVDGELLDLCGEQLKVVSNFAVGYDNVDLEACRDRGIVVTNTPGVLTEATAELALMLTLSAGRLASDAERDLRNGLWTGWDPGAFLGLELRGATVGVVGLGRIGLRYAEMVSALGAEVVYTASSRKVEAEERFGFAFAELDDLFRRSQVVSIHAPGGEGTRDMIGRRELELIGADGVLINTSRGTLVDAEAVAEALAEGRLAAAGLDVYDGEPAVPESLLNAPRCVLLPHIGSATHVSRNGMARLAAENAIAVVDGAEPASRVV
ncbi:MAG: 2-hydroxyacid dehydrogenase [bacterium]